MYLNHTLKVSVAVATLTLAPTSPAPAQQADRSPHLLERSLNGPRFAITYVGLKDELKPFVRPGDYQRFVSQFGWHFEYQIAPESGGGQFLIQFVPMVAGVEHGDVLPNLTIAMGIRLPNGFEVGVGPNVQYTNPLSSALVIAAGRSFSYGSVSIPVNIAYAINPTGNRVSLILGYAIQRSRPRRVGPRW